MVSVFAVLFERLLPLVALYYKKRVPRVYFNPDPKGLINKRYTINKNAEEKTIAFSYVFSLLIYSGIRDRVHV